MPRVLIPVARRSLADDLAVSVRELIDSGGYQNGDRLPSIVEMAHRFGVAHPTLREALRKLETLGFVEIRHGSGVYVREQQDSLLLSNPAYGGTLTRQQLLDVLDARMAIELKAVSLAAGRADEPSLERMRQVLAYASERMADAAAQGEANILFHREIAAASGNPVLVQLLEVLARVIHEEQRVILDFPCRERFRREHVEILEALERKHVDLATERMRAHLESVREVLLLADPERMTDE